MTRLTNEWEGEASGAELCRTQEGGASSEKNAGGGWNMSRRLRYENIVSNASWILLTS
jgi:hypothetical protein